MLNVNKPFGHTKTAVCPRRASNDVVDVSIDSVNDSVVLLLATCLYFSLPLDLLGWKLTHVVFRELM